MGSLTDASGTVLHLDFVDASWEALFQGRGEKSGTHAGLRKTRNSRKPVSGNSGTIRARIIPIAECGKCGTVRAQFVEGSPHAPRWQKRGGQYVRVDCAGDEVSS